MSNLAGMLLQPPGYQLIIGQPYMHAMRNILHRLNSGCGVQWAPLGPKPVYKVPGICKLGSDVAPLNAWTSAAVSMPNFVQTDPGVRGRMQRVIVQSTAHVFTARCL